MVVIGLALILVLLCSIEIACGRNDQSTVPLERSTATSPSAAASSTLVSARSGPRLPTPTAGPNEIRPPELVIITPTGQSVGIVAANAWYDPVTETLSAFEFSGQVILATDPIELPADSEANFEVQESSPFPAGSTDIAFYRYDGNIAMPINPQGQVIGTDPAYVRQEDPVAELQLDGEPLVLANPVPAGKYIVDVTIRWPIPAEAAQRAPEEAKTEYVFVVVVP